MTRAIPQIELPDVLRERVKTLSSYFPDKVAYEKETHSVTITDEIPLEVRVSISYFKFISEVEDVMDNLEIVLSDLAAMAVAAPLNPRDGERRYLLLTKLFFYELLRVRDVFPRFLKRLEDDGLMSKDDRRSTRKLINGQLEEHYLVRNVYLHGHSVPRSDAEFELSLLSMAAESGYEPKLTPLDGGPAVEYSQVLGALASRRREALQGIATDMVGFVQNIVNTTSVWVSEKHFHSGSASGT